MKKNLTGAMLVELVQSVLDAINGGNIPVIENSWKYVIENECIKNSNESLIACEFIYQNETTPITKNIKTERFSYFTDKLLTKVFIGLICITGIVNKNTIIDPIVFPIIL